jgi:hypothetical protein
MRSIHGPLSALIIAGLIFAPHIAGANAAPVFKGAGVVAPEYPHQSIRLESEEVTIRLKGTFYAVEAVFNLVNSGEATTEWIGFPRWSSRDFFWDPFIKFKGSVNADAVEFHEEWEENNLLTKKGVEWRSDRYGRLVPSEAREIDFERKLYPSNREPKIGIRHWLVSRITFPGHAKTTIRINYEARYLRNKGLCEANYIYGTGSLWKGAIGKAVFVIDAESVGGPAKITTDLDADEKLKSMPAIINNEVRWEITDFKPHREAFLSIVLNECAPLKPFFVKAPYVRRHPLAGHVPMPAPPPTHMRISPDKRPADIPVSIEGTDFHL